MSRSLLYLAVEFYRGSTITANLGPLPLQLTLEDLQSLGRQKRRECGASANAQAGVIVMGGDRRGKGAEVPLSLAYGSKPAEGQAPARRLRPDPARLAN